MALKICSACGEMKVKHTCEKDQRGRWVYRDEARRRWSGSVCPPCKMGIVKESNLSVYKKPKMNKCRCCGNLTVNRFMCSTCHTVKETNHYFSEYVV